MKLNERIKKLYNKITKPTLYIVIAVLAVIFACELLIIIFGPVKDTGNIIGGLMGGIFTVVGVFITISYYKKKEDYAEKVLKAKILPDIEVQEYTTKDELLKINHNVINSESIIFKELDQNTKHEKFIYIKNIGDNKANNIYAEIKPTYDDSLFNKKEFIILNTLMPNDHFTIYFKVNLNYSNTPCMLTIYCSDILGNKNPIAGWTFY